MRPSDPGADPAYPPPRLVARLRNVGSAVHAANSLLSRFLVAI